MRRMGKDPYAVRQDGAYKAVYNSSDVVVVSIADAGRFQHFRHARLIPDVTQTPAARPSRNVYTVAFATPPQMA